MVDSLVVVVMVNITEDRMVYMPWCPSIDVGKSTVANPVPIVLPVNVRRQCHVHAHQRGPNTGLSQS